MPAKHPSLRLRRLPNRYTRHLLPIILTMFMTFIVSGIATLRGVGVVPGVLGIWMEAWGLSWLVAYPAMLFMLPFSRKIVAILVEPPHG